jgi:hypothetical protein
MSRGLSAKARLLLPSVALYLGCLPLEAFCDSGDCWPGFFILLFGFLVLLETPANMTWAANPMLFSAWAMIGAGEKAIARLLSLGAAAVAASFLFTTTAMTNTGGLPSPIRELRLGYWLWLGSAAAACLAAHFIRTAPDAQQRTR